MEEHYFDFYFWKPAVPLIISRTLAGKTQRSDLRSVEHESRIDVILSVLRFMWEVKVSSCTPIILWTQNRKL